MSAELVPTIAVAVSPDTDALAAIPTQARSDAELLALWLHGRAAHTQRAYRRAVGHFLQSVRKPLPAVPPERRGSLGSPARGCASDRLL